jgi:hypothetical protein
MTDQPLGLLERLEQRAAPVSENPRRGLNYNVPLAWYRRRDGDIVQLQADSANRAYYEDKGFVMLRPQEAREWIVEVRPEVIAGQKRRAQLVTAIRKIQAVAPQFLIDDDDQLAFPSMPLEELEQFYKDGCEFIGRKVRLPTIRPEKPNAESDANLRGVETSDNMSKEELESKLTRGQGYDPIDEARRRRRP